MKKRTKDLGISLNPSKHFFSMLAMGIAIVMVWRGIWGLLDIYFFPGQPEVSYLISFLAGVLVLYLPDKSLKELI